MKAHLLDPLTNEEVLKLYDWEFEKSNEIVFTTPKGKKVEFIKVVRCKDCKYSYDGVSSWCCSHGVCAGYILSGDFYCKCGERKESQR